MKEMKNAQTEDSDSGQASEEEDENVKTKRTVKYSKKSSGKSTNGRLCTTIKQFMKDLRPAPMSLRTASIFSFCSVLALTHLIN